MTDQQRLRQALHDVVPEPPFEPWRAREARALSRSRRRRRIGIGVATVLVMVGAVPVVRSLTTADHSDAVGRPVHGKGETACLQLEHHDGVDFVADSRVIGPTTAARWSNSLRGADSDVTVCVLAEKSGHLTVVGISRRRPVIVSRGDYAHTAGVMKRLGALQARERSTLTKALFTCPRPLDNDNVTLPGSATLPLGATAARICSDGWYYPSEVMTSTSGANNLVRAINAQPLTYQRGSTCSGISGAHGYVLVFRYPVGTRTVAGDMCGWIGVGPVQHTDTYPTVGDRFLAMLEDQELANGLTPPATCPTTRSAPPTGFGDLTHVVAARFCPAGTTGAGVRLSDDQLDRLTKGTPASGAGTNSYDGSYTEIERACPEPPEGWPHLMLSDAWHHQFSITLKCRNLRFWEMRLPGTDAVHPVLVYGAQPLIRELAAR